MPIITLISAAVGLLIWLAATRIARRVSSRRRARSHVKPSRIVASSARSASSPDWIIRDIVVDNVVIPPLTAEQRAQQRERDAAAASRHEPSIARTLIGGPGNRSSIRGCACRATDVRDAQTWSAHVGVPGAERFIHRLLALEDAALDVIDYPEAATVARLRDCLRGEW